MTVLSDLVLDFCLELSFIVIFIHYFRDYSIVSIPLIKHPATLNCVWFRVQGFRQLEAQDSWLFKALDLEFWVWGLEFRVWGLGVRAWGFRV